MGDGEGLSVSNATLTYQVRWRLIRSRTEDLTYAYVPVSEEVHPHRLNGSKL